MADTPKPDGRIMVTLQTSPYGSVDVDGAPADTKLDRTHSLRLIPGPHKFTVHCPACDDVTQTLVVEEGTPLAMTARLRPAKIEFAASPAEAVVRIGSEQRAASSTHENPFVINDGAPVDYEVSLPGYKTYRDRTPRLNPDDHKVVKLPPLKPE
jgi:hypothetical protein